MSLRELLAPLAAGEAGAAGACAVITETGRGLRFGELARGLGAVTRGLVEAGLQPGDRALFALRPSPEAVVLQLAVVTRPRGHPGEGRPHQVPGAVIAELLLDAHAGDGGHLRHPVDAEDAGLRREHVAQP